jgi:hypothetical protein
LKPGIPFLLLAAAGTLVPPLGASEPPRGPTSIRDAQLLAQPRLTLPAVAAWTLAPGEWSIEASALWANSFSWTQDDPGEDPKVRLFLIDGEAVTADLTVRRGLTPRIDVGVRVPLQWRGGGTLDGFIDWWHRAFNTPDGDRPLFLKNAFRVEGVTTQEQPFSWNDHAGLGLGDLELEARYRVRDGAFRAPSLAIVGRVSLPTGTAPFDGNGLGAGAQLVGHVPLSERFDLHTGAGLTAQDPGPVRGVEYTPLRAAGFLAVEWRPWRRVSLVAETNVASRRVENIESYPGTHWYVNVTGRVDLGSRVRLDAGFTENIISQLTTTDFAFYFGLGPRP